MKRGLQWFHAIAAWLLVAAIAIQVFLAGMAMVNLGGDGNFGLHIEFGYTAVGLAALAVVIGAVLAGSPRRETAFALGLLLLYFLQTALPSLRGSLPAAAALHPVGALLLFGLAVWYARRAQHQLQFRSAGGP
jgi:hypothetical protein